MEPTSSACAQDMEARTHAETGVSRYKASQLSFNIQLPGTRRADAHGGQSCLGRSRRRAQDKRQAGEGETFCPKKEPGPSGWLIGIPGCCFVVGVAGRVKVGVEKSYCQGTRTCRRLHENSDMGNVCHWQNTHTGYAVLRSPLQMQHARQGQRAYLVSVC